MKTTTYYLLTGIFLLFGPIAISQEQPSEEIQIPYVYPTRLLVHYSEQELNEMRLGNPEKFNACVYYHTESYIVEAIQNGEPLAINLNTFDITSYERFRHPTELITKTDWKKGIRIQLLPIDQLEYKLPIHLEQTENLNEDDEE